MTAIVGLTGGIASGKSTVAAFFDALGVPLVDADEVAREVVAPGTEGLFEIVEAFGDAVLLPDGSLDRKETARIVFSDPTARARLNAITHPRIAARSAERISELSASSAPYMLYEAALLVENGLHNTLSALVVVTASMDVQLARLMSRDGLDQESAQSRIDAQLPLRDKVAVADYVISNEGDLETTRARTEEVHCALLARFVSEGP